MIHYMPVQHVNGKLAPSSQVVHNQPDSSETEDGFYYGYRLNKRPEVSRYGLRDRARNLSEHPYTEGEEANKELFAYCVNKAKELLHSIEWLMRITRAFKSQRHYIRVYNYAIAELIRHNGSIPPYW